MIKILACCLFAITPLMAAELRVTLPNDGMGTAFVESMFEDKDVGAPETKTRQEEQISILEFKNLKPGKYRVSYISNGNPIGFIHTIMETQVEVREGSVESVVLFQPFGLQGWELPEDVKVFLMEHRDNLLTLNVSYDGCKKSFELTRGRLFEIGALRSNGEYHITVWNHSVREWPKERKVIFEKSFRATPPPKDPWVPEKDENKAGKSTLKQ